MDERRARWIARITVFGTYLSLFGLSIIKLMHGEDKVSLGARTADKTASGDKPEMPSTQPPSKVQKTEETEVGQSLESLSFKTPGDAALDRLARRAEFEERVAPTPGRSGADLQIPEFGGAPQSWAHGDPNVADLLARQSFESVHLRSWSIPQPARLAVPTFAPAVMALGIIVFAMGLATIWYVCAIGALVFAVAAWRWTGELQGK